MLKMMIRMDDDKITAEKNHPELDRDGWNF